MLIAVCILAYLLTTTLTIVIVFGIDYCFRLPEWLAVIIFIICPLVWGIIKLSLYIREKRRNAVRRHKCEDYSEQ